MNPWNAAELQFDATTFTGVARLFPLPNLVLYPHVMQPLHIFEPRYREMFEDAISDDRLIAMALLEPGWETDYESRPPVAPYACLGKVVTYHQLQDGCYNLLLLGVRRIRLVQELQPLRSFRQAEVELLQDCCEGISSREIDDLQHRLVKAFQRQLPEDCQASEQLSELLCGQLPLPMLTDLAAYTLPLSIAVKQQLLAECCVGERAQTLIAELERMPEGEAAGIAAGGFPPPFSNN